ncbi:MAG: hypothetical protein NZ480_05470, partial [Bdellovibrionaceae bacterium]|nr:hypothetical protein [Pseudobdellovibrionaceae bacterium]
MRNRFIILTSLLILFGNIITLSVQYYLFKKGQLQLIDDRLESMATLLLRSDLSESDLDDVESAQNLVARLLEARPFNSFIRVYSHDLKLLYDIGPSLSTPHPTDKQPHWQTFEDPSGSSVRTVFLPLPKQPHGKLRYIQLGVIMDQALLASQNIGRTVILVGTVVFFTILISVTLLIRGLFSPFYSMSELIAELGENVGKQSFDFAARRTRLQQYMRFDEFNLVLDQLERLSRQIHFQFQNIKTW